MGNCIISVPADGQVPLGNGLKVVKGTIALATYAVGGELLNLSNYLLSTDVPMVLFSGGDNFVSESFFMPAHNGGTVAAGTVKMIGSGASTGGLREANASLDFNSINIGFMAIARGF